MIYTDNSVDENENVKIYASIYNSDEEPMNLKPIESGKEWKMVNDILEQIQTQINEDENEFKDIDDFLDDIQKHIEETEKFDQ